MDINLARILANIADRAVTLWDDGYTAYQWETWGDTYTVASPAGSAYTVILATEGSKRHCSCKSFERFRECKHLVAMEAEYAKWEEIAAEHDAIAL